VRGIGTGRRLGQPTDKLEPLCRVPRVCRALGHGRALPTLCRAPGHGRHAQVKIFNLVSSKNIALVSMSVFSFEGSRIYIFVICMIDESKQYINIKLYINIANMHRKKNGNTLGRRVFLATYVNILAK
jgi:hypothetical protein